MLSAEDRESSKKETTMPTITQAELAAAIEKSNTARKAEVAHA